MIDLAKLSAPFSPDQIDWRVGSTNSEKTRGMALAYIDSRAVMDRLDDVCGVGNWGCSYTGIGNDKTCCSIGILVAREFKTVLLPTDRTPIAAAEWVWKADGAGDTDFEAAKGAFSDSFKRAAVKWGIGRYLYGLDSPWVEIEPMGKSYRIKTSEYAKLRAVLPKSHGNFHGPLKITELKEKMREFAKLLAECEDYDQLMALLGNSTDLLRQCKADLPGWYDGGGDVEGAAARIAKRKTELTGQERV